MTFDRRPFLTSDEELMRLGMIAPRPFLVRRPDRAAPARHWRENLPGAIAYLRKYLREQQTDRENADRPADEARASAEHRALGRVHGRSLFPFPR
jgi:hypothetical protein